MSYNENANKSLGPTPELWDQVAETYDLEITEVERELANEIDNIFKKILNLKKGASILELGSGSGHLSGLLSLKGYKVHLLDFSQKALESSKKFFEYHGFKGEFIEGDITNLSEVDGDYDLIWNSGVMEHFDDEELIHIFLSIKAKTDRFIFLVPNPNSIPYLLFRYKLMRDGKWIYGTEYIRHNYNLLLESVGFKVIEQRYLGWNFTKYLLSIVFNSSDDSMCFEELIENNLIPKEQAYLSAFIAVSNKNEKKEIFNRDQGITKYQTTIFDLIANINGLRKNFEEEKNKLLSENLLFQDKVNQMEKTILVLQSELKQKGVEEAIQEKLEETGEVVSRLASKLDQKVEVVSTLQFKLNQKDEEIKLLKKEIEQKDEALLTVNKELSENNETIINLQNKLEEKHQDTLTLQDILKDTNEKSLSLKEDLSIKEQLLENAKLINELNRHSLLQIDNDIKKAQVTKAWKIMCLLRRVKQQFFAGNAAEKRKICKWLKKKIFKEKIPKELELAQFSPIHAIKIHELTQHEIKVVAANSNNDKQQQFNTKNQKFIKYDTLKQIDIFRFPVIEWNFRWQRPQQMSVQFAEHNHRVFYFSIDTIEIKEENATFTDVSQKVQIKQLQKNVWWVKLCSFNQLNAYRDLIEHPLDLRFLKWSIKFLQARFNIVYKVSILDLPFWSNLAFEIEGNKVVYDCMDDHAGFSTNSSIMLSAEEKLIRSADVVITSSQRLCDKVQKENKSIVLIRNAGEFNHFSQRPETLAPELQNITGPVIGYYGAISEWFDIKLIEQLAIKNKEWTFVLVGDTFGCDISKALELDNVIFTGEKPYAMLPQYLYGYDVCIIPFLVNELTLATNPVKIYEYLAAGLPVVSTKLPELEAIGDIVKLASTVDEFELAIKSSLQENKDEEKVRRQDFAKVNTWNSRYQELNKSISSLFPKVSIVIVTYNNWALTKQCLDSIFKDNYPNIEVIVVDNASSDETRNQLSMIKHPSLKVILSPVNTGFAGGNSIGCQASTGEYIILLNNDTIVPPGWIQRLIKPLSNDESLGMVGPMSNSVGNEQMLDFFIGNPIDGPDKKWLEDFYYFYMNRLRYSNMLGFFCVVLKREVYNQVGDLDIGFGIGMFEDDDYCERVRRAGYKLGIVEDAFVYHHGSASFKKLDDEKYKATWESNKKYFEQKWQTIWQPPKNPNTIFFGVTDAMAAAENISKNGKRKILILGDKSWSFINKRWQILTQEIAAGENLVIASVQTYHDTNINGFQKAGPNLYFINSTNLLEETVFDLIIYCGETTINKQLKSNYFALDVLSYQEGEVEDLLNNTNININQYEKKEINKLATMLAEKLNEILGSRRKISGLP